MIKVENLRMRTLASLKSEGKKVAFICGNRETDQKNISSKKKSFEGFDCNIVPMMYVLGETALKDECKLIDADTKAIVADNEVSNYIVIVDGQHRYTAAICKEIPAENLILFEDYTGANTKKLLATANINSKPWSSSDFIGGAVLFQPENKIAKFAKELSDRNFPISTIGKIMCFAYGKLGKPQFAKIMAGKDVEIKTLNLERAKKFMEAAEVKFEDYFIASRYLIDVVIKLIDDDKAKEDDIFNAIRKLSPEIVKQILNAKSDEKSGILKNALNSLMSA